MVVSTLMNLGVKSMAASYAALQTTGHNIANASVKGYSRQQVVLQTSQGQLGSYGFIGQGVDINTVSRLHDRFLTREATSSVAVAAMDAARLTHLRQLEAVFQPGELGLGNAANELMTALADMANHPGDLAVRQVVLARAGDLAGRFNQASSDLDNSQLRVNGEIGVAVSKVNGLLKSIAETNQRIASMRGAKDEPNDLIDERDRYISQLASLVQISRMEADDGSVGLFTSNGQRLVLGADAVQMQVLAHESDPRRVSVGFNDFGITRTLDEGNLGGGSIAGLLRYQNDDLVTGRTLIGRMAAALAGAINEQQQNGLNLQTPLGQVASQPLFATGAPSALPFTANARDVSGLLIGSVNLTITDTGALQASNYDLREDPSNPGAWLLTRLADGKTSSVVDGDTVDGMRIDFGAPGPQPGDRFLLQPVARAASGMTRLLNDPRDLAAALPLMASRGIANVGSAGVSQLSITTRPLPVPDARAQITFTTDLGDYSWDLYDSLNNLVSSGTGLWASGQPVPTPPADINGFSLQLQGVPRTGDTLTIAPTPASAVATNNGNALLLLGLRDASIVGGRSPTDAWALALSEIGVRTQGGATASQISNSVAQSAEQARSSQSGVNLDEEAASLLQYQQSYQAAAKVLQVAQTLFDTLLQATGR